MLIETQVYENYGAHDWDGIGACPQYWKPKGGNSHYILDVDLNRAKEIFHENAPAYCEATCYFREEIISWEIVPDDFQTEYEIFCEQFSTKRGSK